MKMWCTCNSPLYRSYFLLFSFHTEKPFIPFIKVEEVKETPDEKKISIKQETTSTDTLENEDDQNKSRYILFVGKP